MRGFVGALSRVGLIRRRLWTEMALLKDDIVFIAYEQLHHEYEMEHVSSQRYLSYLHVATV